MDGHKPQVGDTCLENRVDNALCLKPCQEGSHFSFELLSVRRFKMHFLAADMTGNYLHEAGISSAPATHNNALHCAAAGWKQRSMPVEQAFPGQLPGKALCRIEHHFDNAFHIAPGGNEPACINTQATGNR